MSKPGLSSKIVKKYDIHWLNFANDTVNYADIQMKQKCLIFCTALTYFKSILNDFESTYK